MVTDEETNLVYFSDLLRTDKRYAVNCRRITELLDRFGIEYRFLPNTKDIWARDYMPVQIAEDQFLEYHYDPDYLKEKKWESTRTITNEVCRSLDLSTIKTDIVLDGGNVIKSKDCVIMTKKIFKENPGYQPEELKEKLKTLFGVNKLAIIPQDERIFGHADGMIRFIDDKTVLLNGYFLEYGTKYQKELFGPLDECGLGWKFLQFNVRHPNTKLNWAYINFLQMKDILVIPKFNIDEDQQAWEQFCEYYPRYAEKKRILQVDMRKIVKGGGALNCITWNIRSAPMTAGIF